MGNTRSILLFSHIPKCGGTTFADILKRQNQNGETLAIYRTYNKDDPSSLNQTLMNNDRINLILGHFPFGLHHHFQEHYRINYITMLREPISRVISLYNYIKHDEHNELHKVVNSMSLKEFIKNDVNIQIDNFQTRFVSGEVDIPYGQCTTHMVDLAIENLQNQYISFGLTEKFDESLLLFQNDLSWSAPIYYRKKNVTTRKDHIDDETLELIQSRNKLDQELYDKAHKLFVENLKRIKNIENQLNNLHSANIAYTDGFKQGFNLKNNTAVKNSGNKQITKNLYKKIIKKLLGK